MSFSRPWTVLIIHHTHTDIGYTDPQLRIARFHVEFLDRAIEIANRARSGETALSGFRWVCECFWSIEQWIKSRPAERHHELIQCVRDGFIELSGTYAHFTELADAELLRTAFSRSRQFADANGLSLTCALSADINGFGWGYSQALYDAKIENLVTCVHGHNGLAPIGRRQLPFYWETPNGQQILVWNGEHYNLGNVMGLCPAAGLNYSFTDEYDFPHRLMDTLPVALKRLPRYLQQLEDDRYPYNFVPIHVSGATTDNAPPCAAITGFVDHWNSQHRDIATLKMSTLAELCTCARDHDAPIPVYRGDWPDWWSDGFASTPSEVRLAREAMRLSRIFEPAACSLGIPQGVESLEDNLLLYCEHTFNHSASIKAPWDINVKAIGGAKRAVACAAYADAMELRDSVLQANGEAPYLAPADMPGRFLFKAKNFLDQPVTDFAHVYLDNRDYDVMQFDARVVDASTGEALPHERLPSVRGLVFEVHVSLSAGGERLLELREGNATLRSMQRDFGSQFRAPDAAGAEAPAAEGDGIVRTEFVVLEFSRETGICRMLDAKSGVDMLAANRAHAPFTPVYEISRIHPRDGASMRSLRDFNRNRKASNVQRSIGTLTSLTIGEGGPITIPIEMEYAVDGASHYTTTLAVWRNLPRIDVSVRMHKDSIWDPENFYVSLPFRLPESELWIDKAGAQLRPWKDQLPDTLTDWYSIQEGFAWCGANAGLVVATPDTPLLQLGTLEHGKRRLMGHPDLDINEARVYSWLMTNHWGTNFDASLGGFYEFRYRIEWGAHLARPETALSHCRVLNAGLTTFRTRE